MEVGVGGWFICLFKKILTDEKYCIKYSKI